MTLQSGQVFNTPEFSGILGMAFPALSAYDFTPVFDNIMAQKLLPEPMFTYVLGDEQNGEASEIVLGRPDPESYSGELLWAPVRREFYWEIVLEDLEVDGRPMQLCGGQGGGLPSDLLPPMPAVGNLDLEEQEGGVEGEEYGQGFG